MKQSKAASGIPVPVVRSPTTVASGLPSAAYSTSDVVTSSPPYQPVYVLSATSSTRPRTSAACSARKRSMYQRSTGLPRSKPKVRLTGWSGSTGSSGSPAGLRLRHRTPRSLRSALGGALARGQRHPQLLHRHAERPVGRAIGRAVAPEQLELDLVAAGEPVGVAVEVEADELARAQAHDAAVDESLMAVGRVDVPQAPD